MPNPNPPYFVQFSADPQSSATIDHSQKEPGGPNRAGHTWVRFPKDGSLVAKSGLGTARSDGKVPFFLRSVNIHFRLTDYVVGISSDYDEGSCAYNATSQHEFHEHVFNPTRILFRYREPLIVALNSIRLPILSAPRFIMPSQAQQTEDELLTPVRRLVDYYQQRIRDTMKNAQAISDSDDRYQLVHQQCTAAQWKGR
jgi:hypothetical protein